MKPEAQRIAIAEACGWTEIWISRDGKTYGLEPTKVRAPELPDYLNDLNAMHEAEKLVMKPSHPELSSPQEPDIYLDNLRKLVGGTLMNHKGLTTFSHGTVERIVHATAAQRAEAFLRTLNLWKDEPVLRA